MELKAALQHDPNRAEDVLKVDAEENRAGQDDSADVLRLSVATKARAIVVRKPGARRYFVTESARSSICERVSSPNRMRNATCVLITQG